MCHLLKPKKIYSIPSETYERVFALTYNNFLDVSPALALCAGMSPENGATFVVRTQMTIGDLELHFSVPRRFTPRAAGS
jgi:hypothetical protein